MDPRRLAVLQSMTAQRGTCLICCGGVQFRIVMCGERVSMYGTWLLLRNADEQERKRAVEGSYCGSTNTFPPNASDKHYKLQLQITQVINQVVCFRNTTA